MFFWPRLLKAWDFFYCRDFKKVNLLKGIVISGTEPVPDRFRGGGVR